MSAPVWEQVHFPQLHYGNMQLMSKMLNGLIHIRPPQLYIDNRRHHRRVAVTTGDIKQATS